MAASSYVYLYIYSVSRAFSQLSCELVCRLCFLTVVQLYTNNSWRNQEPFHLCCLTVLNYVGEYVCVCVNVLISETYFHFSCYLYCMYSSGHSMTPHVCVCVCGCTKEKVFVYHIPFTPVSIHVYVSYHSWISPLSYNFIRALYVWLFYLGEWKLGE